MRKLLAASAVLLISVAAIAATQKTDDAVGRKNQNDFSGKIISLRLTGDPTSTLFLSKAQFVTLENKRFLVGMGCDMKLDFKMRSGVAWDQVASFIEWTPEEYEDYKKGILADVARNQNAGQ